MRQKKLLIVPVFISHEGCPYRCVFCNQVDINGNESLADKENISEALKIYLEPTISSKQILRREVAFYGGSFTGLPDERQNFLLSLIKPLIENGQVDAIRISTHPLFVDKEKLKYLSRSFVETVELGVQSTNQYVLNESGRPCAREVLIRSVSLIKTFKLKLGLQLMLGLPGDNEQRFENSVIDIVNMKPDFVRLYPALVLRHTALYSLYKKGLYQPWSLERTLSALTMAVKLFQKHGISVIRVGLQPDISLKNNFIAGPFHPSLRYLVDCRIGLDLLLDIINSIGSIPSKISFKVPRKMVSIFVGNRRENIKILKQQFKLNDVLIIPDDTCGKPELVA